MQEVNPKVVQSCQQGDMNAFKELYEIYKIPIHRIAYRFLGNTEDAEDLTHDIFIKVFEKIGSFRYKSSFSTWLYRVAVNMCLQYKRQKTISSTSLSDVEPELLVDKRQPSEQIEKKELEIHLKNAISSLPDSQRLVFIMTAVEEMSYTEVAEILDLTVDAVRMRVYRTRVKLREYLIQKGVNLDAL